MVHRSRTFFLVFEVILARWVLFGWKSLWVCRWVGGDEMMYGYSSVGEGERKSGTKYSTTTTTRVDSTLSTLALLLPLVNHQRLDSYNTMAGDNETDYVLLESADGYSFVVPRHVACASGMLKSMLDEESKSPLRLALMIHC
jgi:hypothetical protein